MRLVVWTEPAVVGASLNSLSSWVQHALANFTVFLKPFEELVVGPVDVFEMTVVWAVFCNYDLPVSFYDCGVESFEAFRAEAGCVLYYMGFGFCLSLF